MKLSIYASPFLAALAYTRPAIAASNNTDSSPTFQLSSDSTFNFHFLIALSNGLSGGSDIAPVLGAAKRIKAGDMLSYSKEYYKLANDTKAQAQDPANAYDPVNVRDTWFSASDYFRKADFFIHRNWSNPLLKSLWTEQTEAFDKAIAALPVPGKRVRLPATTNEGNFTVEAIWYGASSDKSKKQPTLVIGNGFDAAQEDSYHYFVASALERGWNCITYEGPGQSTVRREQNFGFIPDWENVVTPVVDYVLSERLESVDEERLVLLGNSFGGYLTARAAAFEPRVKAAVLIDGVWDFSEGIIGQLPSSMQAMYEAGNYTAVDHQLLSLRDAGKLTTGIAWGLDQGLWAFKTHSPSNFFNQTKEYRLDDVADKIKVPVFVGEAQFDEYFPGQPEKVKNALGDLATLHHFNGVAGYHCQTAATQEMNRAVFAWLNKTFSSQ